MEAPLWLTCPKGDTDENGFSLHMGEFHGLGILQCACLMFSDCHYSMLVLNVEL